MSDLKRIKAKSHPDGECWIWTGAIASGCPVFRVGGKTRNVARWLYTRDRDLPRSRLVVTTCGHKHCVNPEHLTDITFSELSARKNGNAAKCQAMIRDLITRPWSKGLFA